MVWQKVERHLGRLRHVLRLDARAFPGAVVGRPNVERVGGHSSTSECERANLRRLLRLPCTPLGRGINGGVPKGI